MDMSSLELQPRAAAPQQRPRRDGRSWIWPMDADENKIIIKIVAFLKHFLRDVLNVLCVKFLFLARTAVETDLNKNANQVQ